MSNIENKDMPNDKKTQPDKSVNFEFSSDL